MGVWPYKKYTYFALWKKLQEKVLQIFKRTQSVIGFEKKEMLPLTNKQLKSHEDAKLCHICGKYFLKENFRDIDHRKVRDDCHYTCKYRGAAHSICNLKVNLPNEISIS